MSRLIIVFVLLSACSTQSRFKNSEDYTFHEKLWAYLEPYSNGLTPGVAVAVRHKNDILFKGSFGHADLSRGTRIKSNTHFRLASVTKEFTAMAVAILEEEKKISPEDSVRKFLPSFPSVYQDVKIKHLLHHASGIKDYIEDNCTADNAGADPFTNERVIQFLLQNNELNFVPGDKYEYSNTGYVLLAYIVGIVSGLPFEEFLQKEIFAKAQMNDTFVFTRDTESIPERARGYSGWPNFYNNDYNSCNYRAGDSGIYSTLNDMLKWTEAVEKKIFFQNQDRVFLPFMSNNKELIQYGYGWTLGKTPMGEDVYSHSGAWVGFRSRIVYIPSKSFWVVILSNSRDINTNQISDYIMDAYFNPKN